ncbi:MAG: O-antigen ligase family protein [Eubacterium sp.]|nr:O-antigen ligase family protein [Eubacterium sp.]
MSEKIHAFRMKYNHNPGWYWLIATVFLFPILPEYISPFILFAGFIVFKRQWTREGRKAKVGTLGKLQLVFMSLALLSTLWSDNKLDTLGAAGLWWGMFLIQVMIYNLVNTRKKIDNVLKTITLSATANGIVGAIQIGTYMLYNLGFISKKLVFVTPFYKNLDYAVYSWLPFRINTKTFDDRASGFYSNPNLLCTSMLVAYPISIYLFLNAKNRKQKFFYFITNLIISAGISSTLTRAGCVIALLGWVFMFIILAKRHAKELLTIFIPTVAIIVPSILTRYGFIFTRNSIVTDTAVETNNLVSDYIANYTNTENFITAQNSTNAHLEIWKSVWDYITNHINVFIGGLGFGCESTGAFLLETYKLNKPHAHNFIFEIWAELGIIGLLLLVAIICCTFGKLMEINANNGKKFDLVFCVFTSLMLLLLFGLSDYIFNSPKQIILFMIVIGLTQAISQCYDKTLIKSTDDLMKATSKTFKEITELKK